MEERLQDMKWEQLNMLPTEIALKPLVYTIKIKRRQLSSDFSTTSNLKEEK